MKKNISFHIILTKFIWKSAIKYTHFSRQYNKFFVTKSVHNSVFYLCLVKKKVNSYVPTNSQKKSVYNLNF